MATPRADRELELLIPMGGVENINASHSKSSSPSHSPKIPSSSRSHHSSGKEVSLYHSYAILLSSI